MHLLNSLRFWAVSTPPAEIFDCVVANGQRIIPCDADFPYLSFLRAVKCDESDDVTTILDFVLLTGRFEVVPFMCELCGESVGVRSMNWQKGEAACNA